MIRLNRKYYIFILTILFIPLVACGAEEIYRNFLDNAFEVVQFQFARKSNNCVVTSIETNTDSVVIVRNGVILSKIKKHRGGLQGRRSIEPEDILVFAAKDVNDEDISKFLKDNSLSKMDSSITLEKLKFEITTKEVDNETIKIFKFPKESDGCKFSYEPLSCACTRKSGNNGVFFDKEGNSMTANPLTCGEMFSYSKKSRAVNFDSSGIETRCSGSSCKIKPLQRYSRKNYDKPSQHHK